MTPKTVLYRLTIGLLILLLFAAGCGRTNSPEPSVEDETAAQQAEEPTEEPTSTPVPTDTPAPEPTAEPTAEPSQDESVTEAEPEAAEATQPESPLAPSQPISPLESPPQSVSPLALPTITAIDAEAAPGMAYVSGQLMSNVNLQPLANSVVRFPAVLCPEDEAEGSEPAASADRQIGEGCFWTLSDAFTQGTVTDEAGFFAVPDLVPGSYLMLVGDMMTVYAFALVDEVNPYQFTASADEAFDLGQVYVDYE